MNEPDEHGVRVTGERRRPAGIPTVKPARHPSRETAHAESAPGRCRRMTAGMKQGDEAAWREFHDDYFEFLARYARHRGARGADIEDLVQASYLRILRHVKPMDDWNGFEGWLRCLMRCELIDQGRKGTRRIALMEKFAHWQEERRPGAGDAGACVEDLLATLPHEERQLMTRCYVDGWTHQELALEARSTPKAIESKLARLRTRLREHATNKV